MTNEERAREWHIDERCYFCAKPFSNGKPQCEHPEATKEVVKAASILMGVDFCDHFCCGMPAQLCKAVRLVAEVTQVQAEARLAALEEAAQIIDQCNQEGPYNAIQGASRIREAAEFAKAEMKGVKWVQSAALEHQVSVTGSPRGEREVDASIVRR